MVCYIRLVLDGALCQACWVSIRLSSHCLLYYVVDLVGVRFVENWRVHILLLLPMMVMMMCGSVERALRIRHLYRIFTHHLAIVRAQSVLVLVMVLVKLDHGEFLLKRTCALLLHGDAMLQVLVVSALVLARSFHHLTVVGTILFRVGLMPGRRVRECHSVTLLAAIYITAINVTIAVTINDLISIHEDKMSRLLDAF